MTDPDALTARELQVLALAADGMSDRRIAAHLFVSKDTVKTHLRRIFAKLNVRSRAHAVDQAWRQGLLGPNRQDGAAS